MKDSTRLGIGVLVLLGVIAFFTSLTVGLHLSEKTELEYYKTCIDAGGSYVLEGFRGDPECHMPPVDSVP